MDFVLNPCRRSDEPLPAACGERVTGSDGVEVRFLARVEGDRVVGSQYSASSCATLVAYAELLGELVEGASLVDAMKVTPRALIEALPGVPPGRHDRAGLVARAWRSALAMALEYEQGKEGEA